MKTLPWLLGALLGVASSANAANEWGVAEKQWRLVEESPVDMVAVGLIEGGNNSQPLALVVTHYPRQMQLAASGTLLDYNVSLRQFDCANYGKSRNLRSYAYRLDVGPPVQSLEEPMPWVVAAPQGRDFRAWQVACKAGQVGARLPRAKFHEEFNAAYRQRLQRQALQAGH